MGSANLAKTIIIPATIALTIYLLLSFLLIPLIRRYHARYAHYLPLHAISAHTGSVRDRIADGVMRVSLPATWWAWRRRGRGVDGHDNDDEEQAGERTQTDSGSIYEEEGEVMMGMGMEIGAERREALERSRSRMGIQGSEGRLSRELEEGFMDDSESDDGEGRGRGRGR